MKVFHVMHRVGKARHVVRYHDGAKTHQDGSPFFDIAICSNKQKLAQVVADLKREGYTQQ